MSRLRYDNAVGTLGGSLTNSGTTITFASAPSFATIVSPDYIPIVLEPPGASPSANFEIVWLTAYTAAATTGTISRGNEGTTGVSHSNGVVWTVAPTVADITGLLTPGTAANRPAASNVGVAIYFATDTGEASFSDGTNWHPLTQTSSGYLEIAGAYNSAIALQNMTAVQAMFGLFYNQSQSAGVYAATGLVLDGSTGTIPASTPGLGAGFVSVAASDLDVVTAGKGLRVAEGSNAKQGVATLSAGTVVVSNSSVTATSRVILTAQSLGTVTSPSALCVSARSAGTSFTILASQSNDTSVVAYEIFEPG